MVYPGKEALLGDKKQMTSWCRPKLIQLSMVFILLTALYFCFWTYSIRSENSDLQYESKYLRGFAKNLSDEIAYYRRAVKNLTIIKGRQRDDVKDCNRKLQVCKEELTKTVDYGNKMKKSLEDTINKCEKEKNSLTKYAGAGRRNEPLDGKKHDPNQAPWKAPKQERASNKSTNDQLSPATSTLPSIGRLQNDFAVNGGRLGKDFQPNKQVADKNLIKLDAISPGEIIKLTSGKTPYQVSDSNKNVINTAANGTITATTLPKGVSINKIADNQSKGSAKNQKNNFDYGVDDYDDEDNDIVDPDINIDKSDGKINNKAEGFKGGRSGNADKEKMSSSKIPTDPSKIKNLRRSGRVR